MATFGEPAARGHQAPSPIGVLVACGWLPLEQAGDPALRLDATSSSHALARVTAPDGRRVVVKQVPRAAAERGRSLARELFVYRLAHWMPEVAAVVPRPVFLDERRQIVVVESLAEGSVWPDPREIAPASAPEVAVLLGRALARWHRATREVAGWPSPAVGILGMPDALEEAVAGRPDATARLMRSIVGDERLREGLRRASAEYRPACLIHGDLRRENWMLDRRHAPATLRLFDWELSGRGDPTWDVGSVVAEAILDGLRDPSAPARDRAALPREIETPVRSFLRGYAADGGSPFPGGDDPWRRVASCAAARLLHVACEVADCSESLDSGLVPEIVARASALVEDRDGSAELLEAWSCT